MCSSPRDGQLLRSQTLSLGDRGWRSARLRRSNGCNAVAQFDFETGLYTPLCTLVHTGGLPSVLPPTRCLVLVSWRPHLPVGLAPFLFSCVALGAFGVAYTLDLRVYSVSSNSYMRRLAIVLCPLPSCSGVSGCLWRLLFSTGLTGRVHGPLSLFLHG